MPLPVSEFLGISRDDFEVTGAFNCVLDRDSLLFIDPALARASVTLGADTVGKKITNYFGQVLTLLAQSQRENDVFWRAAGRLLIFRERQGTCLGYSLGTAGRGIGETVKKQILKTAKEIVDAGILDPEVLELLALFESGVGCDLVSDMITNIIYDDLVLYSERTFQSLKYPLKVTMGAVQVQKKTICLPVNPVSRELIILVPKEILQNLPLAYSLGDIDWVSDQNEKVRDYINKLVLSNSIGKRKKHLSKQEVRALLLGGSKAILKEVIGIYKNAAGAHYDFQNDPAGEVEWLWHAKTQKYQQDLSLPQNPNFNDFVKIIHQICEKFKHIVEQNRGWSWFYRADNTPYAESAAQLLFYAIASSYCESNNLDFTPEANSGRGPVDFKISLGVDKRILVEIKLSSNSHLVHGLTKQLPTYLESADVEKGILLVIRTDDHKAQLAALDKAYTDMSTDLKTRISVFHVDARRKDSASKTKG